MHAECYTWTIAYTTNPLYLTQSDCPDSVRLATWNNAVLYKLAHETLVQCTHTGLERLDATPSLKKSDNLPQ